MLEKVSEESEASEAMKAVGVGAYAWVAEAPDVGESKVPRIVLKDDL